MIFQASIQAFIQAIQAVQINRVQINKATGDRQSITGVKGAMARKRLSDLLREEAQKPAAESQEINAGAEASPEAAIEAPTEAAEATEAPPMPKPEAAEVPATSLTPAELEGTIAQLQAALDAEQQQAQQQVQELQQTIAQLQNKLQAQIELNQTLKEEAKDEAKSALALQQLKTELEEARSVILQLSEENQTLQAAQKAQAAKALAQASQPIAQAASKPLATQALTRSPSPARAALTPLPQPKAPEPGLESYRPATSQGIVPMPGRDRPNREVAPRKMMEPPTLPSSLPEMSSEKSTGKISEVDIGWMD